MRAKIASEVKANVELLQVQYCVNKLAKKKKLEKINFK